METLVYVDRSRIEPDRAEELETAVRGLVAHIAAGNSRVLSYAIYFSGDRSAMTVVHVHRDSASLEQLLALIAPVLAPFGSLLQLESIDVYGSPSEAVLARLRSKTELLGGTIAVHTRIAGVEATLLG